MTATSANDTLKITDFSAAKLAGSDGQGGIKKIDLGMQRNGDGDVADLSAMTERADIDWSAAEMKISVSGTGGATARELSVMGAETLKATRRRDRITVSVKDPNIKIYGDRGNDFIDARAGEVAVHYRKGDGLDRIQVSYGVNLSQLRVDSFESVLGSVGNPRGVTVLKFDDLALAEAELVWVNPVLIDYQVIDEIPYWLYRGEVRILDKTSPEGTMGVSLGATVGYFPYVDAAATGNDVYLQMYNLPEVEFTDGFLSFGEGGASIDFRVMTAAPEPTSVMQPNLSAASLHISMMNAGSDSTAFATEAASIAAVGGVDTLALMIQEMAAFAPRAGFSNMRGGGRQHSEQHYFFA